MQPHAFSNTKVLSPNTLHGMLLATRAFLLSMASDFTGTHLIPNTSMQINSYFSHTTHFIGLAILKVQGEMSSGDTESLPTAASSVYGQKRIKAKPDWSAWR